MNNVFYELLMQYNNETRQKVKSTESLKLLEKFLAKGVVRPSKGDSTEFVVGEDDWIYLSSTYSVESYYVLTKTRSSGYQWQSEKTPRRDKEAAERAVIAIKNKGVFDAKVERKIEKPSDRHLITTFVELNQKKLLWVDKYLSVKSMLNCLLTKEAVDCLLDCKWENGYLSTVSDIRVARVSEKSDAEFFVDDEPYMLVRDVRFGDVEYLETPDKSVKLKEENPSYYYASHFDAKNLVMYSEVSNTSLHSTMVKFEG